MTPAQPWETLPSTPEGSPWTEWSLTPDPIVENCPRNFLTALNMTGLVSGQLFLMGGLIIPAGKTVTRMSMCTGNTAEVGVTNRWFGVFSLATLSPLSLSADQGAAAWGLNEVHTLDLVDPIATQVDTPVYGGLCVVAGTVNSLRGYSGQTILNALPPIFNGNSSAGLVGPETCPDPVAAPVAVSGQPWIALS